MAGHTFHLGVGGVLGGDELRLHRRVAGLAAELDRFRVLVGLITAEGGDEQKRDAASRKDGEHPSVAWPGEIDPKDAPRRAAGHVAFRARLEKNADANEQEREEEKRRRRHISENADVGIAMTGELVDRDEEKEREDRARAQDNSGPAQPVPE